MNLFNKKPKILTSTKLAIIGAGAVGSTIAYTAVVKNLASQILLIDANLDKERGEILDIGDSLSFAETASLQTAAAHQAADADIIVLTAGAKQDPGQTRLDLAQVNLAVTKQIFQAIGKIKKSAIIIVVSNPVDIITHLVKKISGLPSNQVFGSGTTLETVRLKTALATRYQIYAPNIHGFVLGEHGDSAFVAWSTVGIGGRPIKDLQMTTRDLIALEKQIRQEAYKIIQLKGATFYGIATVVADLIEAVLFDQKKILPISTDPQGWQGLNGLCLGLPAVIGRNGVEKLWPLTLTASEIKKFKTSAAKIQEYL